MNQLAAVNIGNTFFPSGNYLSEITGVGKLVSTIVKGGIVLAGVILLVLMIAGGIGMIAGAGNDNPQQVESGKKAVTSAVLGFLVVFSAFWIVKLIEVVTGIAILQ